MNRVIAKAGLGAIIGTLLMPMINARASDSEVTTSTSAEASAEDPRVLSGRVVDASGKPEAHARVIAHALSDAPSGQTEGRPLGHATTNDDGYFVLAGRAEPDTARNPDGTITVQLRVVTRDQQTKLFGLDLVPPETHTSAWSWGETQDTNLLRPGTAHGRSEATEGVPADDVVLGMQLSHLAPMTASRAHTAKARGQLDTQLTAVETAAASRCLVDYNTWLYWHPSQEYKSRMTPIQKIDTKDRLTVEYTWKDTEKTKHQVTFAGTGENYGGGLEFSQEQVYEAGTSPNFGNNWHGNFRIEERYRKWYQYCVSNPGGAVKTGETKWRPYKWIGGTDRQPHYDMYYCSQEPVRIESRIWVARHSTRRWNGYFNIAGVQLDTSQENSAEHKLSFIPDRRPGWGKLCGNSGDIFESSMVREVE